MTGTSLAVSWRRELGYLSWPQGNVGDDLRLTNPYCEWGIVLRPGSRSLLTILKFHSYKLVALDGDEI